MLIGIRHIGLLSEGLFAGMNEVPGFEEIDFVDIFGGQDYNFVDINGAEFYGFVDINDF